MIRVRQALGRWWPLLLPIALTLGLQLLIYRYNHVADYDESIHLDLTRMVLRTGLPIRRQLAGGVFRDHPPLYFYVMAGWQWLWGEGLLTARLLGTALTLATLLLTAALAREVCRQAGRPETAPRVSLVASALVGVLPLIVRLGPTVNIEMLLVTLTTASLLCFGFAVRDDNPGWYALAGLLAGMALVTKALALALIGAYGLYLLWRHRQRLFSQRAFYALLAPWLLVIVLWVAWALLVYGGQSFGAGLRHWFSHQTLIVDARTGYNWARWAHTIADSVFGYPLLALGLAGAALTAWRRELRPSTGVLALYLGAGLAMSFGMGIKEIRHLAPLTIPLAILAALALDEALRWLQPRAQKLAFALLAGVLVLVTSPLNLRWDAPRTQPRDWFRNVYADWAFGADAAWGPLQQAGIWLETNTPADEQIMVLVAGPIVGYYADRSYDFGYTVPYEDLRARLVSANVLVVDTDLADPNEMRLLNAAERQAIAALIAARFRLVYSPAGRPVAVYFANTEGR